MPHPAGAFGECTRAIIGTKRCARGRPPRPEEEARLGTLRRRIRDARHIHLVSLDEHGTERAPPSDARASSPGPVDAHPTPCSRRWRCARLVPPKAVLGSGGHGMLRDTMESPEPARGEGRSNRYRSRKRRPRASPMRAQPAPAASIARPAPSGAGEHAFGGGRRAEGARVGASPEWGNVTNLVDPACTVGGTELCFQPFGFAGGIWEPATGLVRFGARDYDPLARRWVQKAPMSLGAGTNVYIYVNDDPINSIDPLGKLTAQCYDRIVAGCEQGCTTPFPGCVAICVAVAVVDQQFGSGGYCGDPYRSPWAKCVGIQVISNTNSVASVPALGIRFAKASAPVHTSRRSRRQGLFAISPAVMEPPKAQTKVSLRIWGADLDPGVVSTALAMTPEACHRPGDPDGDQPNGAYREGFCSFGSHAVVSRESDFEKHAKWLLDRLEPHRELLASWMGRGWKVRIYVTTLVSGYAGGPVVSSVVLTRLASLGIDTKWTTASVPGHPGSNNPAGQEPEPK
jgi:RHS repeat-associated protein